MKYDRSFVQFLEWYRIHIGTWMPFFFLKCGALVDLLQFEDNVWQHASFSTDLSKAISTSIFTSANFFCCLVVNLVTNQLINQIHHSFIHINEQLTIMLCKIRWNSLVNIFFYFSCTTCTKIQLNITPTYTYIQISIYIYYFQFNEFNSWELICLTARITNDNSFFNTVLFVDLIFLSPSSFPFNIHGDKLRFTHTHRQICEWTQMIDCLKRKTEA